MKYVLERRAHSYLTSVLDPAVLPPYVVADLYQRRWRIEDAFNTVKRLLGLSYLWTGSVNGIQLQIWGKGLFYAVLAVLRQISSPNKAQTSFVTNKHVHIFCEPTEKTTRHCCSKCF